MSRVHGLDRAALFLGLASIASLVFVIEDLDELRFVTISGPAIAIALVFGALAVAAGLTGLRVLALLAGVGFAAAALLQLIAAANRSDWLGANLSAMSFWLGLAIGLLLIGAAPRGHLRTPGEAGSESICSLARRKDLPIPVLYREGRQRSERANGPDTARSGSPDTP